MRTKSLSANQLQLVFLFNLVWFVPKCGEVVYSESHSHRNVGVICKDNKGRIHDY
jgi:hypothetical protein